MLIRWWSLNYVIHGTMHQTVVHPDDAERIKAAIRDGEPATWTIDSESCDLQFLDFGKIVSVSFGPIAKKRMEDFEDRMAERFGLDWRSRVR
jgi:hypothetical protein